MFISRASQTSINFNLLIFRCSLNIICVCYSEMNVNMNAGHGCEKAALAKFRIFVKKKPAPEIEISEGVLWTEFRNHIPSTCFNLIYPVLLTGIFAPDFRIARWASFS